MTQTWDPANKAASIVLSNGNLTATQSGSTADAVGYATESFASGKYYWELTVSSVDCGVGIGNIGSLNSGFLGRDNNEVGWFSNGGVLNNGLTAATWATFTASAILGLALDLTNGKLWGRVGAAGNWNNDVIGNQNPATNTGGFALPGAVTSSAILPAMHVHTASPFDTITAAFLAASWAGTPPAGFGAFDPIAGSGLGKTLLLGVGGSIVRRDFRPIRALLGGRES